MSQGLSRIQLEAAKADAEIGFVVDLARACYDNWRKANGPSSIHRHWELFDPLYPYGEAALRALFVLLRGGDGHWIFGPINRLLRDTGREPIDIPNEIRGRHLEITALYLRWADEHLAPSLAELHWSADIAAEKASEFWGYVATPDPETNYGGTYFAGCLAQAQEYDRLYLSLRGRIADALAAQAAEWEAEKQR